MAVTTFATAGEVFPEGGTRGIEVSFEDEDGVALTPNSITWTLTNRPARGTAVTVINNREDVSETPASSIDIVLSGDDLAFLAVEVDEAIVERVLTIEYVYDSDLGSSLPEKAQYIFQIENLYSVA